MEAVRKAVVTFAGARDGYQLPLALSEADLLERFVTDMYWPADRSWFAHSMGALLPSDWIQARYCVGLESRKVTIAAQAWATAACAKLHSHAMLNSYKDRSLGAKARLIAARCDAALFCCSYYAYKAFEEGPGRPPFRFLFQIHPHPKTVRAILLEEMDRTPFAHSSLLAESDLALPERLFQQLCREPDLANGWVVASSYTARTLADHGIPASRIHIVPYGVDSAVFATRSRSRSSTSDRPFTVIYVGSMIQRKGLSYLLDAIGLLRTRTVRIILCGRGVIDQEIINYFSDLNIELRFGVSRQQLVHYLHESDVFVLPSLVEGFAHVILEAMSCGIPIITTDHTCGPDVVVEGVHGFIVPIRDASAIAEKLAWGIDHRDDLAAMGDAAAEQARRFTWDRFRSHIRAAYRRMIGTVTTEAEPTFAELRPRGVL